jgi:creatinine amidohydrolase
MTERAERTIARLTEGDEEFRGMFRSWNLGYLSYVDIGEYLKTKDTVLVPMASTEQHGPHLPLFTDTITAIEVS